jgi:formylglycine-generating enzyme required for sulfatase activity
VVLESEIALPVERIHDHHLSWAQWFADGEVPGVLRNKWFERRHLQHQIKRWDRDHSSELHTAWMNGSGMMVWENVFGSWVGWNARDRSILRAILPIQRHFADLFTGEAWTPLVPTEQPAVYGSEWTGKGVRLWTLVNRSNQAVNGPQLKVATDGERYYDLIKAREVRPAFSEGRALLSGSIAPRGIGCFVAMHSDIRPDAKFRSLLASQRALARRASEDPQFPTRETVLKQSESAKKRQRMPEGMIEIPAASFTMTVVFRVRECGFYESCGDRVFTGGELHKSRIFTRPVKLERYAIDVTPVTNAQFAKFVSASRYRPRHPETFLRHWVNGVPPPGKEDHPVVYVDLDDARAYARWAGKRLPTEEEWQYAAEGPQHTRFPWGDEMRTDACNPGGEGTTPVKAFPAGRSAFGCYDLCGNVWHWTESERTDGRTRFCVLKGGSWFKASGSDWYADSGPLPCRFAAKFLLMWPGLDRCSTIGFRCVTNLRAD